MESLKSVKLVNKGSTKYVSTKVRSSEFSCAICDYEKRCSTNLIRASAREIISTVRIGNSFEINKQTYKLTDTLSHSHRQSV